MFIIGVYYNSYMWVGKKRVGIHNRVLNNRREELTLNKVQDVNRL